MDKKSWLAFGIALVANVLLIFGLQLECPWNSMFGYDCGGCGTTRMMFSLLHLDFYQAFRYNPFMFILLIIIIIYMLYVVICLLRKKEYVKIGKKTIITIIVLLIIFTIVRNMDGFEFLRPTVVR